MAGLALFCVACIAAGFGLWMRHSYDKARRRSRDAEHMAAVAHYYRTHPR